MVPAATQRKKAAPSWNAEGIQDERVLFEAAYSGLPIIAPGWSGQCDFLFAPWNGSWWGWGLGGGSEEAGARSPGSLEGIAGKIALHTLSLFFPGKK